MKKPKFHDYRVLIMLVILIMLSSLACMPSENESNSSSQPIASPTAQPTRFRLISTNQEQRQLCLIITPGGFWEIGDQASELQAHITSSLQVAIDGKNITISEVAYSDVVGFVRDANHDIVGSYSSDLSTCFDTSQFEDGIHSISVQASSTSNQQYSQTWEFEIRESEPPTILTPALTAEP
jgi:hypothetical protein